MAGTSSPKPHSSCTDPFVSYYNILVHSSLPSCESHPQHPKVANEGVTLEKVTVIMVRKTLTSQTEFFKAICITCEPSRWQVASIPAISLLVFRLQIWDLSTLWVIGGGGLLSHLAPTCLTIFLTPLNILWSSLSLGELLNETILMYFSAFLKHRTNSEQPNQKEKEALQRNTDTKGKNGEYLSIITLNVNGLNAPKKRHRVTNYRNDPWKKHKYHMISPISGT